MNVSVPNFHVALFYIPTLCQKRWRPFAAWVLSLLKDCCDYSVCILPAWINSEENINLHGMFMGKEKEKGNALLPHTIGWRKEKAIRAGGALQELMSQVDRE